MKNLIKYSPEGIPWREYRKLQFLMAAPLSYSIGLWLEAVWRHSKDTARLVGAEDLPSNAIIYDFHVDVAVNYITMHLLRERGSKVIFTGSHDFDSYWAAGPGSFGAYESWRFDRRLAVKPLDQIVQMLNTRPNSMLGIFTDGGGGKRFRVRESLVKLAIETQRPLVPFRSLYGPTTRIMGDDWPSRLRLKGESVFGAKIPYQELEETDLETSRRRLEEALFSVNNDRLHEGRIPK